MRTLVNVTETGARGAGYLTLYGATGGYQGQSTVNFVAGQTASNAALAYVAGGGTEMVRNASAGVHAVVDLQGWFG